MPSVGIVQKFDAKTYFNKKMLQKEFGVELNIENETKTKITFFYTHI